MTVSSKKQCISQFQKIRNNVRFQLLSIWTRLFLTTLDIIYYKTRLLFQRFKFWLEEEWSMYRDNDKHDNNSKRDNNSSTNKPEPHSRYAKKKSAHNIESESSRSDYKPYNGPVSMTPQRDNNDNKYNTIYSFNSRNI